MEIGKNSQEMSLSITGSENLPVNEADNLNKLRDILFGNQLRTVDSKISSIEERYSQKLDNIIDQTQKTLSSLEQYIKQEMEVITNKITNYVKEEFAVYTEKLDNEKKDRYTSIEKFSGKIDKIGEIVQTQLSEQTIKVDSIKQNIELSLKETLLEQHRDLTQELRQKFEELSEIIINKTESMVAEKMDRSQVVSLLRTLADQIANQ